MGFTTEGVARGSPFFYGVHRDEPVMAVLRAEWAARVGRVSGEGGTLAHAERPVDRAAMSS